MIINKQETHNLLLDLNANTEGQGNGISSSTKLTNCSLNSPSHFQPLLLIQPQLKMLLQTCMQMWKEERLCSVKLNPDLQIKIYKNLFELLEYVVHKMLTQQKVYRIQELEKIVKRGKSKVEDILYIFENQEEIRNISSEKDRAEMINMRLNSLLNQIYNYKISFARNKKKIVDPSFNQEKQAQKDNQNIIFTQKEANKFDILKEIVDKDGFQLKFTVLSQFICIQASMSPSFEDMFSDDSFNTRSCMKKKREKVQKKKNWGYFFSNSCLLEIRKRLENLGQSNKEHLLGNLKSHFGQELYFQINKKQDQQQTKLKGVENDSQNQQNNQLNINMPKRFSQN